MSDAYDTLVSELLGMESLAEDGLRCTYLPSFEPEGALTFTGESLTVSTLTRSAWAFLEKRRGNPYGNPVVDWVEPGRVTETGIISSAAVQQLLQLVPQRSDESRAAGIDGMSVNLSWRSGAVAGHASTWVGIPTPAGELARKMVEVALIHASFEASRAWLRVLLGYFR